MKRLCGLQTAALGLLEFMIQGLWLDFTVQDQGLNGGGNVEAERNIDPGDVDSRQNGRMPTASPERTEVDNWRGDSKGPSNIKSLCWGTFLQYRYLRMDKACLVVHDHRKQDAPSCASWTFNARTLTIGTGCWCILPDN